MGFRSLDDGRHWLPILSIEGVERRIHIAHIFRGIWRGTFWPGVINWTGLVSFVNRFFRNVTDLVLGAILRWLSVIILSSSKDTSPRIYLLDKL